MSQFVMELAPYDPDPVVAQIGIIKLGLADIFPIFDTMLRLQTALPQFAARATAEAGLTSIMRDKTDSASEGNSTFGQSARRSRSIWLDGKLSVSLFHNITDL